MSIGNGQLVEHQEAAPVVWHSPGPPPAAYASQTSLLTMLLERWPTALIVTLLAWACGLTAVWLVIRPKYEVGATIHVSPVSRPILSPDRTDMLGDYRDFVGTVAVQISGPTVIEAAINAPEVRALPMVLAMDDPVREVQGILDAQYIKNTELLKLSMTGEKPDQMVIIVKSVLESFFRQHEAREREKDERIVSSLKNERNSLKQQMDLKDQQLRDLQGRSDPEDMTALFDKWITGTQQDFVIAKKNLALAQVRLKTFETQIEHGDPAIEDPAEFERYSAADPDLQNIRDQLRTVQLSGLNDLPAGRGEAHPDVLNRPKVLSTLRERIDKRLAELRQAFVVSQRQNLENNITATATAAQVLEDEFNRLKQERGKVSGQRMVIEDIRHERMRLENSLHQVSQKIQEVEVEQQRAARVSIASAPTVPLSPNVDKRMKFGAVAIMLGLGLGCGAAMLRSRMDQSVRCPSEVGDRLGVRVLGSVEFMPNSAEPEELQRRLSEPIRGISTALLAQSPQAPGRRRLVTSPTPGSGKSSLALNLARTLAATGRRVLLVDADNQGQGVTRRLRLIDRPGLMEYLAKTASAADVCVSLDSSGLSVIPAGKIDPRFGDLLSSRVASARLAELFEAHDEIIIDSPPVLVKSDSAILATLADEVVLVLRAGDSTLAEANAARDALGAVGGKIVGVVLNAVNPRYTRYRYGYGYQYGYGYPYAANGGNVEGSGAGNVKS